MMCCIQQADVWLWTDPHGVEGVSNAGQCCCKEDESSQGGRLQHDPTTSDLAAALADSLQCFNGARVAAVMSSNCIAQSM